MGSCFFALTMDLAVKLVHVLEANVYRFYAVVHAFSNVA